MRGKTCHAQWAAAIALALVGGACGERNPAHRPPRAVAAPAPPELRLGEQLYAARCVPCHGPQGSGSDRGPPLVHPVYAPNHHADVAFYRAIEFGVQAHHWRFGDMPPVEGVSPEDAREIVRYVRWLQREAGVSSETSRRPDAERFLAAKFGGLLGVSASSSP